MRLVKNALVMPFAGSMDAYRTGVFANGNILPESLITVRGTAAEPQPAEASLQGTSLWAGCLFGHFGHFLLESMACLHAIRQCPKLPLVFVNANDGFNLWHRNFFDFLRIKNPVQIISQPTTVSVLLVPEAKSMLDPPYMADEQLEAYILYHSKSKNLPQKIWLSRSGYPSEGVIEELKIEEQIAKSGWTIVKPEKIPLVQQATYLASADQVAGFEGSAFYSVLFSQNISGKFFVFSRRGSIPVMLEYVLQRKKVDYQTFLFPLVHVSGNGIHKRNSLADWQEICSILAER